MKTRICPGCGAGYHGRRCRSCGFEPFPEVPGQKKPSPAETVPAPKGQRNRYPLLRFLILLYLIYALLPIFRNWGLKLEAMEENARNSGYHTSQAAEPSP